MGRVESAIRRSAAVGLKLSTPTGRGEFSIARVDDDGVVLLLGEREAWTPLSWRCLEGAAELMADGSWIPIGTRFDSSAVGGTLDGYLKGCIRRATAGWVAVLLEHAGIVEIDRDRPARVRLRPRREQSVR